MPAGKHPLELYLADLAEIRATGAATKETSYYPALEQLLSAVGHQLKPRVRCVMGLRNLGAGLPDGGLFTEEQFKRGSTEPTTPQNPSRGVIEVKGVGTDFPKLMTGEQVARYWARYKLVLVTDYREFVLLGERDGKTVERERYTLAPDAKSFWQLARHAQKAAKEQGGPFLDFLKRTLLHAASLTDPKDVAWFLASYARDALHHVDHATLPALDNLRGALEQALGLRFEGRKGEHFFRSTLVQTLFYGVFAAWVLWHRSGESGTFDWRKAAWTLHVPMINALYAQIAQPARLKPLHLEEPLDHAANTLGRVDRGEFFKRFEDRHAVQYFYEPFLEAFDPELRKELGVWYTPEEIVQYMVARVDRVLVSELGIADGLADPQVYVLDPCCGTGTYLVETLRVIGDRLRAKGADALAAQRLKQAMTERIFGFEILPAPFVVSHLQIGLLLATLGAPLAENERVGVYLTNALTGWQPPKEPKTHLLFPELEAERDAAEEVKRQKPILVILGNPPYNAFAGVAQGEEQDLVEPYKAGLARDWGIRKFNLDDLYMRFFRLAERRIVEQSDRGVVCFISNFSYLSEPSFVVLRQRLLSGFDRIWVDCLNGDSRDTGKRTPEGQPDPSVFSTPYNREGIRVGTTIGLLVKSGPSRDGASVRFRHFWGASKRADLLAGLSANGRGKNYTCATPSPENRYSFRPEEIRDDYREWPRVVDLCSSPPISGLQEMRRGALMDLDRARLEARMQRYFDRKLSWDVIVAEGAGPTKDAGGFVAKKSRTKLLSEDTFNPINVKPYALYPFDTRWCYYSETTPLWNRPRPALVSEHCDGNRFFITRMFAERPHERAVMLMTPALPDYHLLRPNAVAIPIRVRASSGKPSEQSDLFSARPSRSQWRANLSDPARQYLASLGLSPPDGSQETADAPWLHALAIGYSPLYLNENADGIRQDWPRVPLPATKEQFLASAELGKKLAALLMVDAGVRGVTTGEPRSELRDIAVVSRLGEGSLKLARGELGLTAGWGHAGKEGIVMPGKGKLAVHPLESSLPPPSGTRRSTKDLLGPRTYDVYLNGVAYWRNVPEKVWDYTIGGYQVVKKWLSYRERDLLGRDLTMDEVDYVTQIARRIAAILLLSDELDENYRACRDKVFGWPSTARRETSLRRPNVGRIGGSR